MRAWSLPAPPREEREERHRRQGEGSAASRAAAAAFDGPEDGRLALALARNLAVEIAGEVLEGLIAVGRKLA